MNNEQAKPWYKQFWPWFLIALPGSVVIASFITIAIAVENAPQITRHDIGKFAKQATIETTPISQNQK